MTKEEVKQAYSMRNVVERYGFYPNRAGFIPCPFHKEKTASMKIYKESYYCFGCGASGDIFSFIQEMDKCDFKTAFYSLGGTYEKPTFSSELAIYKAQKEQEMRIKTEEKLRRRKRLNNDLIDIYRAGMLRAKPMSDAWCDCYNALQIELYHHEILNGKGEGVLL